MSRKKPLVLVIRDGWGIGDHGEGDMIWTANTERAKYYEKNFADNKA